MPEETWNPDQACEEMAALFAKASEICSHPIYQQVSTEKEAIAPADIPPIRPSDSGVTSHVTNS
ncbi:MAG TPA: hypothetical protein V6D48_14390 [Oculatellaceae cyanobacterium]